MKKAVIIKIIGQVQGVGFRYNAKGEADRLGICGFAKNEPGGEVLIEAEGEEGAIDQFISWCKSGPDSAQVERVETKIIPPPSCDGFDVIETKI